MKMQKVIKRDGRQEDVSFDKIMRRIRILTEFPTQLNTDAIDIVDLTQSTIAGLYDGMKTTEIDNLASEVTAAQAMYHPDYNKLAGRIVISNLHKQTPTKFSDTVAILKETGILSDDLVALVEKDPETYDKAVGRNSDNDFTYDYFAIKTLMRSYLLKINDEIVERPQHMLMRVALGIWGSDTNMVLTTYELLSEKLYTNATPTLFNSGTKRPQLASCFLMTVNDDSIEGIYKTLGDCAVISKNAGGIGVSASNVRSSGSKIKGTGGNSNGIIPFLRVYNETARAVNQGGKRNGSFAIYLEPWHADIYDFIDLRKNHGKEEMRARDLFLALWTPDLFMQRVKEGGKWYLMDPSECPGLNECYGETFEKLYNGYVKAGKYVKEVEAQDLFRKICDSQVETGTPYMLYKDAANIKSNQKNLGTIKSSNLCTEIIEYTDSDEIAVCNLASLNLTKMVKEDGTVDFEKLESTTFFVTLILNKVIDVNYYPLKETQNSNFKHRPIGIGVQGFADLVAKLGLEFEEELTSTLNKNIFETIYYGAMRASVHAATNAGAYKSIEGSPISNGQFQFDLWGVKAEELSGRYDWEALREDVKTYGVRNSLLLAPMPTASTSQILGNNEAFEPFTSNLYIRRTLGGEFIVLNKHLVKDLEELGKWNKGVVSYLVEMDGSIQGCPGVPENIQARYKTVWEMSQKTIIDQAADRGIFICQSQSMNLFMASPSQSSIASAHMYAWSKGLKTGMYYLRTKPAVQALKGLGVKKETKKVETEDLTGKICSVDDPDCLDCSS